MKKIHILSVLGVSGSGKTEMVNSIMEYTNGIPEGKFKRFVDLKQVTTRKRRENEPEDAYVFLDNQEYQEYLDSGKLTAITKVNGNRYGTLFDIDELSNQYDLSETIFTVVANPLGHQSLLETVKDPIEGYEYNVKAVRIVPYNNIPYAQRENRDYKRLSEESIALDELNLISIENYTKTDPLSTLVLKPQKHRKVVTFEKDKKTYLFKDGYIWIRELGDLDEDWKRFIYIQSGKEN